MLSHNKLLRITLSAVTLLVLTVAMVLPAFAFYPAPTTATTEPVATYDPCYDGHVYVNGFCTYCGCFDPDYLPPVSIGPDGALDKDHSTIGPNSAQSSGFTFAPFALLLLIGSFLLGLLPVILIVLLIVVIIILIVKLAKKKKD